MGGMVSLMMILPGEYFDALVNISNFNFLMGNCASVTHAVTEAPLVKSRQDIIELLTRPGQYQQSEG